MGIVPASAVWTIAVNSPGESFWNLVKNQRFLVEKTVFFLSRHSASLIHGIEATTTTSLAHQKIATIEDQFASPHGIHANCSYVKTANVDCGNKGGTIGHYYSHY
eukprot:7831-Heterococcus_DN1.PRE.1